MYSYITIISIIMYYNSIIIHILYLLLYYIIFLYNVIFIEYCFNLSNNQLHKIICKKQSTINYIYKKNYSVTFTQQSEKINL